VTEEGSCLLHGGDGRRRGDEQPGRERERGGGDVRREDCC